MWIDLENIEKTIYELVDAVVTKTYLQNNPIAVPEKVSDFAVVQLGDRITDLNAYKKTELTIYLYVREKKSTIEDTRKLHDISNAVLGLFPYSDERISVYSAEATYGGRMNDLSRVIIGCEMIIK